MSDAREDTKDLDCPQCGGPIPALRWEEPREEWPEGEYLAWQDEEHVCPWCKALCQVGVDGERAYLTLIHCRHGRAEDEPCWRCDVRAWPSNARYRIRSLWRRVRCIALGHVWHDCDSTGAPWMKEWEACSRCIKVRRKVGTP